MDSDGKRLSFIGVPLSIDRSPYFQVKVPICVVRNGDGPSVLLMAGNHGDEYEGELTLARLIRRLDPARVRGRVTILPMANVPAVRAARRCSPLDGGNLNRSFPGDPGGTPTQRIAYFLEQALFPRHGVMFDIHSGGTSMAHLPTALIERQADPECQQQALGLLRALGLGHGFVADNGPAAPTSLGAAARAGIIGVSGEFGGGGTVTPATMATTAAAVDRLLMATGSIRAPVLSGDLAAPAPMRLLSLARHSQMIFATRPGWWEPAVDIGTEVAAGDRAGWYHDLDRLQEEEMPLHFPEGGVVISMRLHTMCEPGDALIQVAAPAAG
ncbi:MAG: succinylglutamate desuccinylase/aspartoacylase family protein [Alphaproteobacteria bacterium]